MWWSEGGTAHEWEDTLLILTLLSGLKTREARARALRLMNTSVPTQGPLSRKRIGTGGLGFSHGLLFRHGQALSEQMTGTF